MKEILEYPSQVMRLTELRDQMGFPEAMLLAAYREKGQAFAQKADPSKKNSPIIFITKGFEEWRAERQRMENRAIQRGGGLC